MFLWYTLVYVSGETLFVDISEVNRQAIYRTCSGRTKNIAIYREAQDKTTILMYIPTPLGAFHLEIHPWLPWYLVVVPGESLNIQPLYHIQCANHTFDDLYTMASFTEMADSEPRQLSRSLNVSTLASKFQQVNTTVHVMFFLHHIDHFLVLKL